MRWSWQALCSCLSLAAYRRALLLPSQTTRGIFPFLPLFEGKNKPASLERIEKMGSDSHNNGKAGRVKQAQSDLEQHQDHSKLFKLLINCRSSHPGVPPKPSRVQ